ncbi:SHOCT domain-containing protein [Actinacidiphila soli]|nr:hypothetical protein [Actinacidiphila soli]
MPGATPQQLLAERFARGEIDDDEYYHSPPWNTAARHRRRGE